MPRFNPFLNGFDADSIVHKTLTRRGPYPGDGRGPGRRWGGIVEKTPVVWITWLVSACKKAGVNPLTMRAEFCGITLRMTVVKLTFGYRYYWLCPLCGRRCEAIYNNGRVGCQRCLHLGYSSEAHRPTSAWAILSLFSRNWPFERRRDMSDQAAAAIVKALRGEFERKLTGLLDSIKIETDPAITQALALAILAIDEVLPGEVVKAGSPPRYSDLGRELAEAKKRLNELKQHP